MNTHVLKASLFFALLALLLVACSGNDKPVQTNDKPDSSQSGNKGTNVKEVANNDKPAEEEEPVTIKIMSNILGADAQPNQTAFIDILNEKFNVDLQFLTPPSAGYTEQLQLALISGDLPDVIFFPSEQDEMFLNAVNDGAVIALNDYLNEAENLQKYTYDHSWEALKTLRDEQIFAIPRTSITRYDGFHVRKDWMDNLGIEMPENHEMDVAQFTDMLRRFTLEDPDGNGLNDTYGYGTFMNASKVLEPVLLSELGHLGWQAYEGAEQPYILPEYDRNGHIYEDVITYTRDLYAEGVVDPDSPINDSDASNDRFLRGINGVVRGFAAHVKTRQDNLQKNIPEGELTYLFVKGPDGEIKGSVYGTGVWGVWAVSSEASRPDKIVQVFDYLLSDEGWALVSNGIEDVHYAVEGGQTVYLEEASKGMFAMRSMVRRNNDVSFFMNPVSFTEEDVAKATPWLEKSVAAVVVPLDQGFLPQVAREPNFMDFKLTWDEQITRMMLGDLPIEQLAKLREDWYAHGGERYVQEMNDFIASKK